MKEWLAYFSIDDNTKQIMAERCLEKREPVNYTERHIDTKEVESRMKKAFWILLLVLCILIGGCGRAPAESPEVPTETAEEPDTTGQTETTVVTEPETQATEETLPEPETEPVVQNDSFLPGSVLLNLAELRPEDGVWALGGSKVAFGHYDGAPVIFRVLASPETQRILDGEESLLLDCDTVLEKKCYDDNFRKNDTQVKVPSEWAGSDIDLWLNHDFYGDAGIFSPLERAAIAETGLDAQEAIYTIGNWTYEDYGGQGHLFLLSAGEAKLLYTENAPRAKEGASTSWWVRSSFGHMGNGAGSIHGDGHICNNSITNFGVGVSPAMNIKRASVLFASSVSGEEAVRKLTLLDSDKTVKLTKEQAVTREETEDGPIITIPYTCTGADINRISVLITDREFSDTDAQVLYYGGIQPSPKGTAGKGAFLLPSDLELKTCGKDYFAYILAEEIHGERESSYASSVCPVTIPTE